VAWLVVSAASTEKLYMDQISEARRCQR